MNTSAAELVQRGYEAAARGDLDAIAAMLAPDVRWHEAGYDDSGCQNRVEALEWMRRGLEQGIPVEPIEVRELSGDRVLVLLRRKRRRKADRAGKGPTHGQILRFRDGLIAEMLFYRSADAALAAAGRR